MLYLRFWAGRRDRMALALIGMLTLAIGLSAMSTLTDSVRGTVAKTYEQNWRASSDILVHMPLPAGANLPDLLEPNVLTTLPPGITNAQWEAVRQVAGVTVAAPIAVVGYLATGPSALIPSAEIPLPSNGRYQVREVIHSVDKSAPQVIETRLRFARAVGVAPDPSWPKDLAVINNRNGPSGLSGIQTGGRIPMLLAGIDPGAERKLVSLDQTVTEGRYFSAADSIEWRSISAPGGANQKIPSIPVLVNLNALRSMGYDLTVEELNPDESVRRVVYEHHWGPDEMAKAVKAGAASQNLDTSPSHTVIGSAGPLRYDRAASPFPDQWPTAVAIRPQAVDLQDVYGRLSREIARIDLGPTYRPWQQAEWPLTPDSSARIKAAMYTVAGYFDSANLATAKDPQSNMPLMTYHPAEALQVFDADRKPLNPPRTISGAISPVSFLSSPPALLTTIQGAEAVAGDGIINAIQVKVADTEHFTPEVIARVRATAREIETRTGLVAEVTMGSSPANVLVQAPPSGSAAGFGWLEERWIHKNAAVTAVEQMEFGYSAYVLMILVVGALYTLATALAGVTARRRELAVATAVGWPRSAIVCVVIGEQLAFGLVAGLLAALVAAMAGAPAPKVGIMLFAGVALYLPAMLAAGCLAVRTIPAEGLKWGDTAPARRVLPGAGTLPLVLSSLLGRPVRTVLTIFAIALPSALMLVLTFISRHLHGLLYTTITGQYAALKAGPLQYALGAVALAIAAVAAYDLVRQNAADHRHERALLHALGWPRSRIGLTLIIEGGLLGAAAGLLGDLLGLGVLTALYGRARAGAWLAAATAGALPLGLGLLAGALSAAAELRTWGRAALAGVSERQTSRYGRATLLTGAVLLLLAVGLLVRQVAPQLRWPAARPAATTDAAAPPVTQQPPHEVAEAGGVTLWYPEQLDKTLRTAVTARVGQAASLLKERLGWQSDPATVIELVDGAAPEYGQPLRLAPTDATVPAVLFNLAQHGVMTRSHNQAAGWLREGVARYALDRAGYAGRQAAFDLLGPGGPVSFDQLESLAPGSPAQGEYERAVATAHLLAVYLEARRGAGAVDAVLDRLARAPADPQTPEAAREAARNRLSLAALTAAGEHLPDLEQAFNAWVRAERSVAKQPAVPPDPTPWMVGYAHPAPKVRTQYRLNVDVDPARFWLTADQQVRFTNNETLPLDSLYFHLFPNAPYFARGKRPGALTVQTVSVNGQTVSFSGGTSEIMGIRLPTPLAPGATVTVDLAWNATVPDLPDRFGTADGTIFLGNAYPILALHDGGGWHLDRYVSVADPFYSEVADYDVTFSTPLGYQVAATGHGDGPGHFKAENVRDFGAALSPNWQVSTQTVDGVQIHYYANVQPAIGLDPKAGLAAAAGALQFFDRRFGDYPYKDLTVVGQLGMEYPQFVLAADAHAIAHEIGHQWWYGAVGNDENRQIWDEGLTEFSALAYLAAAGQAPAGTTIAAGPGAMDNTTYRLAAHEDGSKSYPTTIYGRGQQLWAALRGTMGDARFTAMLQDFYALHRFGIATWADWRAAVGKAGGADGLVVFDGYVYAVDLPVAPKVALPSGGEK